MRLESTVWSTTPWYQAVSRALGLAVDWLRGTRRGGASVPPGAVALMRMPLRVCSIASDAVIALTPPLAAEYGTRCTPRVATDETLTMTPRFCSTMKGSAARQDHSVGNSERRISAS